MRIRTSNLLIRSQVLYPVELWVPSKRSGNLTKAVSDSKWVFRLLAAVPGLCYRNGLMKRFLRPLIYPVLAIAALAFVHFAHAEGYGAAKPLVVIRFNQPQVYYEQSLYQAVSKAVAVRSDLMFDVVSAAPGGTANDAGWVQTASAHTQMVVASMENMGIPQGRMSITGQREAGLHYDEVRIFVH